VKSDLLQNLQNSYQILLATPCFKPTFLRRLAEEYQHYTFFTDYLKVGDITPETHFVLTKGKQSLTQQQPKL